MCLCVRVWFVWSPRVHVPHRSVFVQRRGLVSLVPTVHRVLCGRAEGAGGVCVWCTRVYQGNTDLVHNIECSRQCRDAPLPVFPETPRERVW